MAARPGTNRPRDVLPVRLWTRANLTPFLAVSIAVHAVLVAMLPYAPSEARQTEAEPFTEVALLPDTDEVEAVVEPAIGGAGLREGRGDIDAGNTTVYLPADEQAILGRAQAIRRSAAPEPMDIDVDLPASSAPPPAGLDIDAYKVPLFTNAAQPGTQAPGVDTLQEELSVVKEVADLKTDRATADRPIDFSHIETELKNARGAGLEGGLRGPAAARRLLEQPAPPVVEIHEDTILRLRFWVLPDGTVGEVYPLQKGEAELERVASDYLRRWRFNPLANGTGAKVWGEITIRFRPR